MRKFVLASVLGLLAAQGSGQELFCGHNGGNNLNIGDSTDSYRCGPAALVRGSSPITTSSGSGTVTSDGAFVFAASTAPGGVGATFKNTGIVVEQQPGGLRHWYAVTAKASGSSITVVEGSGTPTITGTWSNWSYWESTCYRSGVNCSSAETSPVTTPALWGWLKSQTRSVFMENLFFWARAQTGTTGTATIAGLWSPVFSPTAVGDPIPLVVGVGVPGYANTNQAFNHQNPRPVAPAARYQLCETTLAANASYAVACFVVAPFKVTSEE
jgi:hypothetical protein